LFPGFQSNYAIPIIFDLASSRNWKRITDNPPIRNLDGFIRSLDKFQATPWTIRTLKLDAVEDFTLVNIIQGQYLTIESPEKARVAYEDFIALHEDDRMSGVAVPPERIPLGEPLPSKSVTGNQVTRVVPQQAVSRPTGASPAFFQTKSGFDLSSLHPHAGPPSEQNQRPASVILVASLIENCTNVGGLSRVAESFGLEALYIGDSRQTAHKDFKATSVTSEKHFPIHELKAGGVPDFLIAMKRNGYVAVGIEQTDQSSILGTEDTENASLGILPRKCVLVLGSEKGGITAEVLAALDRCVEIRTVGVTRSLSKCFRSVNFAWPLIILPLRQMSRLREVLHYTSGGGNGMASIRCATCALIFFSLFPMKLLIYYSGAVSKEISQKSQANNVLQFRCFKSQYRLRFSVKVKNL
jgi:tRNA guanosine-2'-O-methyltransferase